MLTMKATVYLQNVAKIFIKEMDDFIQLLDNSLKVVFTTTDEKSRNSNPRDRDYFFFPKEGFIIYTPNNDYKSIQDYIDSKKLGFSNSKEYAKYCETGAGSRDEYEKLLLDSFSTIEERNEYKHLYLDKLQSKIPELLKKVSIHEELRNLVSRIKSPKDLLLFSRDLGSPSLELLESFLISGFSDYEQWKYGKENGFNNEEELIIARNAGFLDKNDYSLAQKIGISENEIFKKYKKDLANSNQLKYNCFEFSFLPELKVFPNRFSKLLKVIKDVPLNRYGNSYIFSDSFKKINSFYELSNQLKKEPINSDLTPTIADGLSYQNSTTILTKIAIDASNVCWYEKNKNNNSKLLSSDLLDLERIVKEYGAKEIIFIADENLKFEVDDKNILNQLEKEKRLIYSHKEPADKQLLSLSLNRGYVIISNDQYRDWTEFTDDSIKRIGFIKDSKYGFDLE